MSRFSNIPFVKGASDDEASIHLHGNIGPSKPLITRRNVNSKSHLSHPEEAHHNAEDEILRLINSSYRAGELDTSHINEFYDLYQQGQMSEQFLAAISDNDASNDSEFSDSDTYNEKEYDELRSSGFQNGNQHGGDFLAKDYHDNVHEDEEVGNASAFEHQYRYPNQPDEGKLTTHEYADENRGSNDALEHGYQEEQFIYSDPRTSFAKQFTSEHESPSIQAEADRKDIPKEQDVNTSRTQEASISDMGKPKKPETQDSGLFDGTKFIVTFLITFSATCLLIALTQKFQGWPFALGGSGLSSSPILAGQVSSKLQTIEKDYLKLTDFTNSLSKRQEFLESNFDSLNQQFDSKIDLISRKFETVEQELAMYSRHYSELSRQFEAVKANPVHYDELSLTAINDALEKVSKFHQDFDGLKSKMLDELLESLPNYLPVYIKNKKIHFIPQFHSYLYTFVDNYAKEKNLEIANKSDKSSSDFSWDQFVQNNSENFNSLIDEKLKNLKNESNVRLLNKDQLEKLFNQKFSSNNRYIFEKFNNLVDKLNLVSSNTTDSGSKVNFNKESNKILLNNLLETFSKGSVKINYADYNLGSRILGFLTNLNLNPSIQSKLRARSTFGKIFFGWYDYLSSSSATDGVLIKSPKYWKYNANNALIDDGSSWQCESNHCSLGIRMSSPIILTDLVIKNSILENEPNNSKLAAPTMISLFVKPKNFQEVEKLVEYINSVKINPTNTAHKDKYLKKFIEIQRFRIPESSSITHIKLPISIINLRIPVKDIYVELRSPKNTVVTLNNIKAFGISEFNSYKYNQEFELVLDKLYDQEKSEEHVSVIDLNDELYDKSIDESSEDSNNINENEFDHPGQFDFDSLLLGEDQYLF